MIELFCWTTPNGSKPRMLPEELRALDTLLSAQQSLVQTRAVQHIDAEPRRHFFQHGAVA